MKTACNVVGIFYVFCSITSEVLIPTWIQKSTFCAHYLTTEVPQTKI